jgi:hypothetical protein
MTGDERGPVALVARRVARGPAILSIVTKLPSAWRWLFWDVDFDALDARADSDSIVARVLEHGGLSDVRVLLELYGEDCIHDFFQRVGHPDISARTTAFWRAFFEAEAERWASPPDWRKSTSAPWID